jgi:Ca2+-transporting ATPase
MRPLPEHPPAQPLYTLPPAAVVAQFGTDPLHGLPRSEVARRLQAAGPNTLPTAAQIPVWQMLLTQCKC